MPGKPILNIDELNYEPWGRGDKFQARIGRLGIPLGAQKLGYNVTVLPPGKRAYPAHSHSTNEEMFFVLEGSGTLRVGKETYPIRQGDVIACPPGGPETAHQIVNSSDKELKFLAVSTMISPEIANYPDSGKVGAYLILPPAADGSSQRLRYFAKEQGTMDDYWDGEA
jgi:uncharacterized cupin superfamily protein